MLEVAPKPRRGKASQHRDSIPVNLLNGSVLGHIKKESGKFIYEELAAFTMTKEEVDHLIGDYLGPR
jgi:hypothetical protein